MRLRLDLSHNGAATQRAPWSLELAPTPGKPNGRMPVPRLGELVGAVRTVIASTLAPTTRSAPGSVIRPGTQSGAEPPRVGQDVCSGRKEVSDVAHVLDIDGVPIGNLFGAVGDQLPGDGTDGQAGAFHDRLAELHLGVDLDPPA
jgi:hypothetical protein